MSIENYFSQESCVHKEVCFYEKKVTNKLGITKAELYGKCSVCNEKLEDQEIRRALLREFPLHIAKYKFQAFLSKSVYSNCIYQLEKEKQEIVFNVEQE